MSLKNSLIFDILMMGELFQNNHHKLPNRVNFGAKWFEFDPTYPVIKLLSWTKIIKMKESKVGVEVPKQKAEMMH